nr:hypothetical protein BaRGS_030255 [Batillaria attramentaria]
MLAGTTSDVTPHARTARFFENTQPNGFKFGRETLKATLLAVSALLGIVTVAGAVTGTAVLFVHRARAAQRRDEDKSPAEYSTNSSVNAADFTPGGSTGTDYSPDSHDTEDGAP